MDCVRMGVIGLGNMGSSHAKCIADGEVRGLMLTAVVDKRADRRAWACGEFAGDVAVFEHEEEMLTSGLIDAVLIAAPHYDHPRLVMEALKSGLHVMCEKPAGVYTAAVREMNEEADRHDLVFGMMFNQRTDPVYRKMRQMVVCGNYGEIKRVNWIVTDWYRTQAYYNSGGWRATWKGEGGGVLLNQCPHNLDLLQWICGMPSRVRAFCHEGKWHDIEVEDDVTAYLEYPNGATGVFVTSTGDAPGTNRFELDLERARIVCEDGKIQVYELEVNEREYCFSEPEGFRKPKGHWIPVETEGENTQHKGVLQAFADAVLEGRPLVADGREGIRGLTISNAMHLSSWLDRTVEIPFDEELFLAELEKRRACSRKKRLTQCKISGFADEIAKSFEIQLRVMKELGQGYLELRSADGTGVAELGRDEALRLKKKMDELGIKVSSIGSPIGKIPITEDFGAHFKRFCHVVELAGIFETPYIRMFSFYIPAGQSPEKYRDEVFARILAMVEYAEEQEVILLHENEKGIYGDTAPRCRELMDAFYGKHFRAVFDFANFVQCGQDAVEAYELLSPFVEYVHVKDARADDGQVVLPGDGDGHVGEILSFLDDAGYRGFLSLEPHLVSFEGIQRLEQDAKECLLRDGITAYRMAFGRLEEMLDGSI